MFNLIGFESYSNYPQNGLPIFSFWFQVFWPIKPFVNVFFFLSSSIDPFFCSPFHKYYPKKRHKNVVKKKILNSIDPFRFSCLWHLRSTINFACPFSHWNSGFLCDWATQILKDQGKPKLCANNTELSVFKVQYPYPIPNTQYPKRSISVSNYPFYNKMWLSTSNIKNHFWF